MRAPQADGRGLNEGRAGGVGHGRVGVLALALVLVLVCLCACVLVAACNGMLLISSNEACPPLNAVRKPLSRIATHPERAGRPIAIRSCAVGCVILFCKRSGCLRCWNAAGRNLLGPDCRNGAA